LKHQAFALLAGTDWKLGLYCQMFLFESIDLRHLEEIKIELLTNLNKKIVLAITTTTKQKLNPLA
jgi:hypothetical protein